MHVLQYGGCNVWFSSAFKSAYRTCLLLRDYGIMANFLSCGNVLQGATTDFTETLNRIMVLNLAFTMKTRGIADFEQMVILKPALEQILTGSQHTWSVKTMNHFPPLLRDALSTRIDKRPLVIQAWQQVHRLSTS